MRYMNFNWRYLAAVGVTAASLAACHQDNGSTSGVNSPPQSSTVQFSTFAKNAFAASANSSPISLDGVTFNFDVDNDPTAFDMLIMSGAY